MLSSVEVAFCIAWYPRAVFLRPDVTEVDVEMMALPACRPTRVLNVVDVAESTFTPSIWYVEKGAIETVCSRAVEDACNPPWNQIAVVVAFAVAP